MRSARWEWLWYVAIGFVLGGSGVYVVTKLNAVDVRMLWYEWILAALFMIIFVFMGQTVIASSKESEPRAAWMTLLFEGIPLVLIGAGLTWSVLSRALG
jgi:hypothetical protein